MDTKDIRVRNVPRWLWKTVKGRALDEERPVYEVVVDALKLYLAGATPYTPTNTGEPQ